MDKLAYRQNIVIGGIAAAVAVTAFVLTFGMPGNAPLFPRVVSGILFLLGALLMATNFRSMRRGEPAQKPPVNYADFVNPFYSLVILCAYATALTVIGFYVSTMLLLLVYMTHLGVRSGKTLVGVTAAVLVAVYLVFGLQLGVPLPRGFLI